MTTIFEAIIPTMLLAVMLGILRLGVWLLEVRADGRETKQHLARLNGRVERSDQMVGALNKQLYIMQGRLDERLGHQSKENQ